MKMIFWGIVVAAVAVVGYIRLAPSSAADWHHPVEGSSDADFASGALRVVQTGPEALALADRAMMAEPRTTRLAGSVADGRITYITRSQVMGFPDYTTIEHQGDTLRLLARLRFGKSDLGVNRARLERITAAIPKG